MADQRTPPADTRPSATTLHETGNYQQLRQNGDSAEKPQIAGQNAAISRTAFSDLLYKICGAGPLKPWRSISLREVARLIRDRLELSTFEHELELDMRDLADQLEELAGVEKRPPVEGPIERKNARRPEVPRG